MYLKTFISIFILLSAVNGAVIQKTLGERDNIVYNAEVSQREWTVTSYDKWYNEYVQTPLANCLLKGKKKGADGSAEWKSEVNSCLSIAFCEKNQLSDIYSTKDGATQSTYVNFFKACYN
jgi:hypothetical protein